MAKAKAKVKSKTKTETTVTIKKEHCPIRCEICHQADRFDPLSNTCTRCSAIISNNVGQFVERDNFLVRVRIVAILTLSILWVPHILRITQITLPRIPYVEEFTNPLGRWFFYVGFYLLFRFRFWAIKESESEFLLYVWEIILILEFILIVAKPIFSALGWI